MDATDNKPTAMARKKLQGTAYITPQCHKSQKVLNLPPPPPNHFPHGPQNHMSVPNLEPNIEVSGFLKSLRPIDRIRAGRHRMQRPTACLSPRAPCRLSDGQADVHITTVVYMYIYIYNMYYIERGRARYVYIHFHTHIHMCIEFTDIYVEVHVYVYVYVCVAGTVCILPVVSRIP